MLDRLELLVDDKINDIKNKTVLILGIGGVGGYALEALVRSGINNIIIVDSDKIELSNLNRQIISNITNIGDDKVDVAEKRIKLINPSCNVTKINEFITKNNLNILFNNKIDYLVDCCDTVETKFEIIKYCLNNNIKFISSMGTAKKFYPDKLKIMDLDKTTYDPLAKKLRKMVCDNKLKGKIKVVCSTEQPANIRKMGSNCYVPATSGMLCASYIINDIVGVK